MHGSWPRSTSSPWASSWRPAGTRRTDGSGSISCIRSSADAGSGSSSSARRLRGSRPAVWDWTGMPASRRTTDARVSWTSTPTRGGGARLVCGVPERRPPRSWTRASSRSNRSLIWTLEPSVLRGPSSSERGWPNPRLGMSRSFADGHIAGLATARPARQGWKIGPLYAPDASGAAALLAAVVQDLDPDDECWLDTPNPNAAATALMKDLGATGAPTSGRMVRGQGPVGDTSIMFGLLAHEVG